MLMMRISIKKVSITDIFFSVFVFSQFQVIWSNFLESCCKYMFFKGWSNIFIHKFLKFWCTNQLFSEVFEAILNCKWKLVYIGFDGLHFLNIQTFFVEKIFFKIFVYFIPIFNGILTKVFRSFRYQFLLRQIKRSKKEELGIQKF